MRQKKPLAILKKCPPGSKGNPPLKQRRCGKKSEAHEPGEQGPSLKNGGPTVWLSRSPTAGLHANSKGSNKGHGSILGK